MLPKIDQYADRVLAIVALAYLDDMLRELLRARLVDDAAAVDQAFDRAPLGRAEARIQMAYLVGLIAADVRDSLLQVNTIRNRFAHYHEIDSFEEPGILEITRRIAPSIVEVLFKDDPSNDKEGRSRFVQSYVILMVMLTTGVQMRRLSSENCIRLSDWGFAIARIPGSKDSGSKPQKGGTK